MSLSELNAFFYRLAVSRVCARDISGSLNLEPTERSIMQPPEFAEALNAYRQYATHDFPKADEIFAEIFANLSADTCATARMVTLWHCDGHANPADGNTADGYLSVACGSFPAIRAMRMIFLHAYNTSGSRAALLALMSDFCVPRDRQEVLAQALFNLAYEFNDLRTHNRLETYVCYPQKLANLLTSSTQECAQKQDLIRDHSLIYGPAPVTALRELQERFPETWSVPSYIPSLAIRWICADEAASRALATATYAAFVATVQAMTSGESTRKLARFYAAA